MDVRTGPKFPHTEFFPQEPAPRGPSVWCSRLAEEYRELVKFWPVILNMVTQELRVRYQRSVMGFFWTLLNPLLMMGILSWVFSHVQPDIERFPLFLFSGMVPWSFLSTSLTECAYCIINNEGLIRKIYLPKLVFPLAKVLVSLVTFLLSFAALFVLMFPMGARPGLGLVLLPMAVVLLAVFATGLGLIVATANTFYRDCGHLVSVFLQAWYFATPILFPTEKFGKAQWQLRLNPAYYFIEIFHDIVYVGDWPRLGLVAIAALIAVATLGVGYAVFKSHEDKMVFRL